MKAQHWRIIEGTPYSVSNRGAVMGRKGNLLKPWSHTSGHLYVSLKSGLPAVAKRQVHHLVLLAFVGARPDGHECRHLDGVATNNNDWNLAWGTRAENIQDFKRHTGRYHRASLSDDTAAQIRSKLTGQHGNQTQIAREFGVSAHVVNGISKGHTYDPGV